MTEAYLQATEFVTAKLQVKPQIGLILGSGLGILADEMENPVKISYDQIPGFPVSTVEGHAGQLVIGRLEGKQVLAMQGRFHFYEGYSLAQVTLPVKVMKKLGVETVIVTNAAGGVNDQFSPGDLMLIEDHINFTFQNPLIGPNDTQMGVRFPDMSKAYSQDLKEIAYRVAQEKNIPFQKGVYLGVTGPSYETPAEIRLFRELGADAVRMSTVPEVIVAVHSGMKVLGISCITNLASGISDQALSHDEVMETADLAKAKFIEWVKGIIERI